MHFRPSVRLLLCSVLLAGACGPSSKPESDRSRGGTSGTGGAGGSVGGSGGSGGLASAGNGGSVAGAGTNAGGSGGASAGGAGATSAGSAGASGNGASPGGAGAGAGNDSGSAGSSGSGASSGAGGGPADLSAELYDPENLPRFDIELPQASLDALRQVSGQDDPAQDVYVTANLTYGAETVTNVGLRIKGEGSFQPIDSKPAFKLKFDEFVADQSFRGLKRLTLNNLFEDPSFVAERLAYDVYRAAGIAAPRCNSALVYVNGEFYGVYANVESEDKTFLRRWFADEDGNLYEEGQEDFVPGAEQAFDLETNETENDRTDLVNLIAAVQGASPATFLADIGVAIDTAQFLRFTAVEAAVNQWDMYAYTVFWPNNFRMYHDPTSDRFHFIPWGHDMSMKPYRDSDKPFVHLFELARQYDRPNLEITSGLLFQRCLESPGCVTAYREAVDEVIEVYEDLELETVAARYYDQIKDAVYMDTRKDVCCGLSNQDFDAGYQSVVTTIRGRVAALRANLDE
jgi:hypothetical protein